MTYCGMKRVFSLEDLPDLDLFFSLLVLVLVVVCGVMTMMVTLTMGMMMRTSVLVWLVFFGLIQEWKLAAFEVCESDPDFWE